MNINDFIQIGSVKWGKYPYYVGTYYDEENVIYVTSGARSGVTHADVKSGEVRFSSNSEEEKVNYLPIQVNGKFGFCYGSGMFQRTTLSSYDDLLRNIDTTLAIPTSDELIRLLKRCALVLCR